MTTFVHAGRIACRARAFVLAALASLLASFSLTAAAQTSQGELEGRPAPVNLRRCVGGANAGALCNQDSVCPGSICRPRNIFNPSVAVYFNATNTQLDDIRTALTDGSATLFDVTDGQAEFGRVTIFNNAPASTAADIKIQPASNDTWWNANTGNWRVGGSVNVSINYISGVSNLGGVVAHEFVHLAFDPRDEYESRAAGCLALAGNDSCPSGASNATSCLMDGNGSELCWGQATTMSTAAGNHDSDNSTEQSRCRSNRSCWDQVVWSYPNTFLKPAAAPDPAANGATATPPIFNVLSGPARVVLVLDQSGSMALETPTRMERLITAAKDFVTLAPAGTELGIVSFATDFVAEKTMGALGADRSDWIDFIDALTPTTRTNIGAGLDRARTQISGAGGVTGSTFVVLMTDGLNNEPAPPATAQAALDTAVAALLADGIPVHVTCTGADLGLQSQCSEIALGAGGTYVDSATAAELPLSFIEIAARGFGFERIGEWSEARRADFKRLRGPDAKAAASWIGGTLGTGDTARFRVERGSRQVMFTVQWPGTEREARATLVAPDGRKHKMLAMPQGLYARVKGPKEGVWRVQLASAVKQPTLRAYSENPSASVAVGVRRAQVEPGQPITFFAYPRAGAKALSHPLRRVEATLRRPDGKLDRIVFSDQGRADGDDVADDGVFTAVYQKTDLRGAYSVVALWPVQGWGRALDAVGHTHGKGGHVDKVDGYVSPAYLREVTATAAVLVKGKDIDIRPDDPLPCTSK